MLRDSAVRRICNMSGASRLHSHSYTHLHYLLTTTRLSSTTTSIRSNSIIESNEKKEDLSRLATSLMENAYDADLENKHSTSSPSTVEGSPAESRLSRAAPSLFDTERNKLKRKIMSDEKISQFIDAIFSTSIRICWSKEEEMLLIESTRKSRMDQASGRINWNKVIKNFPNRTLKTCEAKYITLMKGQFMRRQQKYIFETTISRYKDVFLDLIRKNGEHDWSTMSSDLTKLTGMDIPPYICSYYWIWRASPKAQNAPKWTKEKSKVLLDALDEQGNDPVYISYKYFPEYPTQFIELMVNFSLSELPDSFILKKLNNPLQTRKRMRLYNELIGVMLHSITKLGTDEWGKIADIVNEHLLSNGDRFGVKKRLLLDYQKHALIPYIITQGWCEYAWNRICKNLNYNHSFAWDYEATRMLLEEVVWFKIERIFKDDTERLKVLHIAKVIVDRLELPVTIFQIHSKLINIRDKVRKHPAVYKQWTEYAPKELW